MLTIRENRYPFLTKVGNWNRDRAKTGDTLVEKCCHFFDLFRLLSGAEITNCSSSIQRNLLYGDEEEQFDVGIIDAAYVLLQLAKKDCPPSIHGCLELCMYAEGSRHQEEVIVTGLNGRIEAYLPENKVYLFKRPKNWTDRSMPPPNITIEKKVFDCNNMREVHGLEQDAAFPEHTGYHYGSTSVEWHHLIRAINSVRSTGKPFEPAVSLLDGIAAVEAGLMASDRLFSEE
jgi:predicted dehydrogenase